MNANEYQKKCLEFAIFPKDKSIEYLSLGIASESGEICDKIKKAIRGDTELDKDALALEIGDLAWYCAVLSDVLGYDLDAIMEANIEKLDSRKQRNILKGSGDYR